MYSFMSAVLYFFKSIFSSNIYCIIKIYNPNESFLGMGTLMHFSESPLLEWDYYLLTEKINYPDNVNTICSSAATSKDCLDLSPSILGCEWNINGWTENTCDKRKQMIDIVTLVCLSETHFKKDGKVRVKNIFGLVIIGDTLMHFSKVLWSSGIITY